MGRQGKILKNRLLSSFQSLDCHIDIIQYLDAPFSDHSVVHLKIKTTNISHGKGLWKMNVSTIKSELFQKSFKSM